MACSTGGCSTGCSRLGATDWLENMLPPGTTETENIYEVRFKTTRKAFYRNINNLELITGDMVVVESDRGFDIGMITLGGELARLQMRKKKFPEDEVLRIFRVATTEDCKKLEHSRSREYSTLTRTRTAVREQNLRMKMADVEFQADGTKAIFYYTAETRVDFRQLIKQLAQEFHIRIEMRQIGLRQEAGIVGGVGGCGRELCCSSWLTHFKSVGTSAARYQNLSLNPGKITGMCGRLKCCLNYELDTYLDALKGIPKVDRLETNIGTAILQKTDIFRKKMWFSYGGDANWVVLTTDQVFEIVAQNKQGIKPETLAAYEPLPLPKSDEPDFVDVVGQSNLHERRGPGGPNNRRNKKKGTVVRAPGERNAEPRSTDGGRNNRRGRGPKPGNTPSL